MISAGPAIAILILKCLPKILGINIFNMDEIAVAGHVVLFCGSLATIRYLDDRGFSHVNQMAELFLASLN